MTVGRPAPAKLRKLMMEFYNEDGRTIYIALEDNLRGVLPLKGLHPFKNHKGVR
jgi:hypothetical protein